VFTPSFGRRVVHESRWGRERFNRGELFAPVTAGTASARDAAGRRYLRESETRSLDAEQGSRRTDHERAGRIRNEQRIPGYRLHQLKGKSKKRWSIWVSGNWRLTFEFDGGNVFVLDYEDYH